jgi:hypothetical protein
MKQLLKLLVTGKKRKLHGQPRIERSSFGMRSEFTKIIHLKQGVISMAAGH